MEEEKDVVKNVPLAIPSDLQKHQKKDLMLVKKELLNVFGKDMFTLSENIINAQ